MRGLKLCTKCIYYIYIILLLNIIKNNDSILVTSQYTFEGNVAEAVLKENKSC